MAEDTATQLDVRFRIEPIQPSVLERVRTRGIDDLGNPLQIDVDHEGGSPLRCCLRDTRPGERRALLAYGPFPWKGPYAEVGPVFIHAERCEGYHDTAAYPEGFRHRRQVLRAYGLDRSIVDATVVDGFEAETVIAHMLANPQVDFLHSRNVAYGCYMFQIHRAASAGRPSDRDAPSR
jgi:hypothetical protein